MENQNPGHWTDYSATVPGSLGENLLWKIKTLDTGIDHPIQKVVLRENLLWKIKTLDTYFFGRNGSWSFRENLLWKIKTLDTDKLTAELKSLTM